MLDTWIDHDDVVLFNGENGVFHAKISRSVQNIKYFGTLVRMECAVPVPVIFRRRNIQQLQGPGRKRIWKQYSLQIVPTL